MFETFSLTLNPWLPVGVLSSTFLLIPDLVVASDLPARAESCSDRIIGMDSDISTAHLAHDGISAESQVQHFQLLWSFQ